MRRPDVEGMKDRADRGDSHVDAGILARYIQHLEVLLSPAGHGFDRELNATGQWREAMLRQLLENSHKGTNWHREDPDWLMGRVREEVEELADAVRKGSYIREEAADVANMAMMVADACDFVRGIAPPTTAGMHKHEQAAAGIIRDLLRTIRDLCLEPNDGIPMPMEKKDAMKACIDRAGIWLRDRVSEVGIIRDLLQTIRDLCLEPNDGLPMPMEKKDAMKACIDRAGIWLREHESGAT